MIELIVHPNLDPVSWEYFCAISDKFSIALDGYVNTGPKFQNKSEGGPRANFNHHEDVDRLATRATCGQILMAVRTGLFSAFRKQGEPTCSVYVNDCDQDVCTSYFILKNPWVCENAINPLLNKLVDIEDRLDATGGAYPYPKDLPILKTLAWVFKPYTDFRLSKGIDNGNPKDFQNVISSVEDRINKYLNGTSRTIALNLEYELLYRDQRWAMVKEIGAQARTGMLSDGIMAYISLRERSDGAYNYTIGRMSQFIDFDIASLLGYLSYFEPDRKAQWGGGTTSGINIGGSSRKFGSKQEPSDIINRVNDFYKNIKKSSCAK